MTDFIQDNPENEGLGFLVAFILVALVLFGAFCARKSDRNLEKYRDQASIYGQHSTGGFH